MMILIWPPADEDWNDSEDMIADTASSETYCVLKVNNELKNGIPHIVLIEPILCISFTQLLVFGAVRLRDCK